MNDWKQCVDIVKGQLFPGRKDLEFPTIKDHVKTMMFFFEDIVINGLSRSILLEGRPGTGKKQVIRKSIEHFQCQSHRFQVSWIDGSYMLQRQSQTNSVDMENMVSIIENALILSDADGDDNTIFDLPLLIVVDEIQFLCRPGYLQTFLYHLSDFSMSWSLKNQKNSQNSGHGLGIIALGSVVDCKSMFDRRVFSRFGMMETLSLRFPKTVHPIIAFIKTNLLIKENENKKWNEKWNSNVVDLVENHIFIETMMKFFEMKRNYNWYMKLFYVALSLIKVEEKEFLKLENILNAYKILTKDSLDSFLMDLNHFELLLIFQMNRLRNLGGLESYTFDLCYSELYKDFHTNDINKGLLFRSFQDLIEKGIIRHCVSNAITKKFVRHYQYTLTLDNSSISTLFENIETALTSAESFWAQRGIN